MARPRSGVEVNPWALRQFRQNAGLKTNQLAAAAQVSASMLYDVEAGRKRMAPDALQRVAGVLNVHVAALRAVVCGPECPCRSWPGEGRPA